MVNELVDTIGSLVMIMDEETARLLQPGRASDHHELVAAKLQLVGSLEQRLTALLRDNAAWHVKLERDERDALLAALDALRCASEPNLRILVRQIDLSTELMSVVAAEAQRLTGKRSASYCGTGVLTAVDVAAPISVNASL